jgi:hypothetical protein
MKKGLSPFFSVLARLTVALSSLNSAAVGRGKLNQFISTPFFSGKRHNLEANACCFVGEKMCIGLDKVLFARSQG